MSNNTERNLVTELCKWTKVNSVKFYGILGRLRFHYDNEHENDFLCADNCISCVIPGLLFVIVVEDVEREATSRSSLCVQTLNENDSDI